MTTEESKLKMDNEEKPSVSFSTNKPKTQKGKPIKQKAKEDAKKEKTTNKKESTDLVDPVELLFK